MKSLLSQPACWLVLLIAVSFANSLAAHRFSPVVEPDSQDYQDFEWLSLDGVLSNHRTPGYPAFLVVVQSVSRHENAIPVAHWLALIAASLLFYQGCTLAGISRNAAVFAAGGLMLSRAALKLGPLMTADSLAISLSIASAGFFLGTLAPKGGWGSWIGVTLLTFLAYQTRPAYLFLIPLWPALALMLHWLVVHREAGLAGSLRRSVTYALATLTPFIAYSLLRLIVAGHFGLVSFGGYNFVGVVGQFLEPDSVSRLSPDVQPLAEEMLRRRGELDGWQPPSDFLTMELMYNPTVWELAVPSAEAVHGEDAVAVNAALSSLGRQLLLIHPGQYIRWLAWNSWHAVVQVVQLTALDRATVFLMLILLATHLIALWRGPKPVEVVPADSAQRFRDVHLVLWTALVFAVAKGALVVLVEPANDRYMTGAMSLLPAALAIFASGYVKQIFPALTALERRGT